MKFQLIFASVLILLGGVINLYTSQKYDALSPLISYLCCCIGTIILLVLLKGAL